MQLTIRVVHFPAMTPVEMTRSWVCVVAGGAVVWLDGTPQRLSSADMLHLERACADYAVRCVRDDETRCYAQVWDVDERRHVFFEISQH